MARQHSCSLPQSACWHLLQVGVELRANARCSNIEGRELTFQCDVYEGERHIAQAEIKRATVERVTFLARTAAESLLKN